MRHPGPGPPLIVFRDGVPLATSTERNREAGYRQYRAAVARSQTFGEVLSVLEGSLHGLWRLYAASDFAPRSDYARRFLNTLAQARWQPCRSEADRRRARRAVRVVSSLLMGNVTRPGRKQSPGPTPYQVAAVTEALPRWLALIHRCWASDRADRWALLEAAVAAAKSQLDHRAWRRLLARPQLRPFEVALFLTAAETGLSTRQVRRLRRTAKVDRRSA